MLGHHNPRVKPESEALASGCESRRELTLHGRSGRGAKQRLAFVPGKCYKSDAWIGWALSASEALAIVGVFESHEISVCLLCVRCTTFRRAGKSWHADNAASKVRRIRGDLPGAVLAVVGDHANIMAVFARRRKPFLPQTPQDTYLISVYSCMTYLPPSRPKPDCFTPPKGACAAEGAPSLAPTMP